MGLSRERIFIVGLLALAGWALVVDQGLLRPRSASAAGTGPAVADATGGSAEPAAGSPAGLSRLGGLAPAMVAARLRLGEDPDHAVGDAFALPAAWASVLGEPPAEEPRGSTGPLVLTAVMPSSSGGVAVINGSPVRVGEPVGATGYRLVRVVAQSAVLEGRGEVLRLELPLPTGPGRGM